MSRLFASIRTTMSESLREQLMKAGFKEVTPAPTKTKKGPKQQSPNRHSRSKQDSQQRQNKGNKKGTNAAGLNSRQNSKPSAPSTIDAEAEKAEPARIAQKKAIKKQIKELIESHCVKEHSGSVTYSYQLGQRVKQLYVSDEYQRKLASGELQITRLNGNTYLIPPEVGQQIIALNPDWALIGGDDPAGADNGDDEYADYQVPDDLTW